MSGVILGVPIGGRDAKEKTVERWECCGGGTATKDFFSVRRIRCGRSPVPPLRRPSRADYRERVVPYPLDRRGDVDEEVPRAGTDLRPVAVDYRRERQHRPSRVGEDGVDVRAFQYRTVGYARLRLSQYLRDAHAGRGAQRGELERGVDPPVREGRDYRIEVVQAYGGLPPLPGDPVVEVLLHRDQLSYRLVVQLYAPRTAQAMNGRTRQGSRRPRPRSVRAECCTWVGRSRRRRAPSGPLRSHSRWKSPPDWGCNSTLTASLSTPSMSRPRYGSLSSIFSREVRHPLEAVKVYLEDWQSLSCFSTIRGRSCRGP